MIKKTLLLSFSLLIVQPVAAKDYIIELLVFQQTTRSSGIDWQPGVLLPSRPEGLSVFADNEGEGFIAMESGPALSEMADTLSRSKRFPLISYRTWQQPGLARDDAQAIQFAVGQRIDSWDTGEEPPRAAAQHGVGDIYKNYTLATLDPAVGGARSRTTTINGTVKVALGRYLHLYTDLVYTDARTGRSTLQQDHRRMRSKRSHYIDNPAFGIIAHITPVEEEKEEAESSLVDEPATLQDAAAIEVSE